MNKEELKLEVNRTIDAIADKIKKMKSEEKEIDDELKSKYDETIEKLLVMKGDLETKYKEFKGNTEHEWQEFSDSLSVVKDHFRAATRELQTAF